MCFVWSAKRFDVHERQLGKVILPKMSLAEINATMVYKPVRWEEQHGI